MAKVLSETGLTKLIQLSKDEFLSQTDTTDCTMVQLATVATTGSYTDLSNKPTIPTVNNATLTIQKNGTTVNSFTANASSDVTANITVPTKTSDLTNDDGFITGITSSDVTTALGYTPYNSTNPSGYQANVIETVKVNNTALTPSSKAVNITVPTKVSDLTNDSGYTTNVGTVTSVNNTSPDSNGNVTISIPSAVTESTVSGWGFTKNTGTVTSVNNVQPVNGNVTLNIPTVNNGTITINQGGALKGTFTVNQSGNSTIELDAGGSSVDTAQLSYYGTCSTSASTQNKVVVCEGFVLKTGASIRVKFTNAQSYNGQPTLNVNSSGAKSIMRNGTTAATRYDWLAGEVVSFTYDGTNWIMEDAGIASTNYYGYTKLTTSAISTNTSTSLTPNSLNGFAKYLVVGADSYSASETYAVGDRVRHSWYTWECTTAITTPEEWDETHWRALDPIQTQIDEIATDLNGKVDIADLQEVQCVVETYQNGASWYRVWSDGWCEQGGYIPAGSTSSTINLLKNYANVNYQVQTSPYSEGSNFTTNITSYPKSVSQFIWNSYNNSATSKIWQARGYIEV